MLSTESVNIGEEMASHVIRPGDMSDFKTTLHGESELRSNV